MRQIKYIQIKCTTCGNEDESSTLRYRMCKGKSFQRQNEPDKLNRQIRTIHHLRSDFMIGRPSCRDTVCAESSRWTKKNRKRSENCRKNQNKSMMRGWGVKLCIIHTSHHLRTSVMTQVCGCRNIESAEVKKSKKSETCRTKSTWVNDAAFSS
jgi:hypothetical protein